MKMMRKTSAVAILWALFVASPVVGFSQQLIGEKIPGPIRTETLDVTYSKTTNLLFPYGIKWFDVGSRDVLVQIAGSVKNLLQVKAAKQGFSETNLTVVTADGKFYSYLVNYTAFPNELNKKVGVNTNYPKSDALFDDKSDNEAMVYDMAEQLQLKKPVINNTRVSTSSITLNLSGVYSKENKLYFQFGLENSSNLDYTIESLRFFIRDQKKSKRTASQEIELKPLQLSGNTEIIRGNSKQNVVVVLPKFTIPDKKAFFIQLMEQDGGRHLELKIKNKAIVNTKVVQ